MKKILIVLLLVTVMLMPLGVSAQDSKPTMDPAAVVEAIYASVAENDIDAATALLADDAVLTLIPPPRGLDGTFVGKAEISDWYAGLAADNGRAEFSDVVVSGNTASMKLMWYSDHFTNLGVAPAEFDGVAVVQDGMLKSLSWVFTEEFLMKLGAAMAQEADKAIISTYMQAWEQGDGETLNEVIGEGFVNHSPPLPAGKEDVITFAAEHRAQFPTGEYTVEHMVMEGDLVFLYGIYRGTHDGEPFGDIPASGAEVEFEWSTLLRLENGKIVERWGTSASITGMLIPLGFTLSPPE